MQGLKTRTRTRPQGQGQGPDPQGPGQGQGLEIIMSLRSPQGQGLTSLLLSPYYSPLYMDLL